MGMTRIRLVLDVAYQLNGVSATEANELLRRNCEQAIGSGMLTGYTEAEVDEWAVRVAERPQPLSEDELAGFMLERIENGDILLEDIPSRMARYGMMEADAFIAEMAERIENAKAAA